MTFWKWKKKTDEANTDSIEMDPESNKVMHRNNNKGQENNITFILEKIQDAAHKSVPNSPCFKRRIC